jgi:hypothetical protein
MIINRQKPIEFNSPAEVVFNREDLKKAITWFSKKPVARLKHVFLYGNYYAVSIYDQKIHIHRLLMMYWLNRDLQSNEYIHHKDGNKFNNLKENLELMLASAHQSLTNKGKKFTASHKAKISAANKRRKGIKLKKRVNINLQELAVLLKSGYSINKVAKHFKCDWSTIRERIHENPELSYNGN